MLYAAIKALLSGVIVAAASEVTGTGKDIESFDLAVSKTSDQRLTVVGDAWLVSLSDERRAIIEVFEANGNEPMKAPEIAARVGKPANTPRVRLYKMVKDGDLTVTNGSFRILDHDDAKGGF